MVEWDHEILISTNLRFSENWFYYVYDYFKKCEKYVF